MSLKEVVEKCQSQADYLVTFFRQRTISDEVGGNTLAETWHMNSYQKMIDFHNIHKRKTDLKGNFDVHSLAEYFHTGIESTLREKHGGKRHEVTGRDFMGLILRCCCCVDFGLFNDETKKVGSSNVLGYDDEVIPVAVGTNLRFYLERTKSSLGITSSSFYTVDVTTGWGFSGQYVESKTDNQKGEMDGPEEKKMRRLRIAETHSGPKILLNKFTVVTLFGSSEFSTAHFTPLMVVITYAPVNILEGLLNVFKRLDPDAFWYPWDESVLKTQNWFAEYNLDRIGPIHLLAGRTDYWEMKFNQNRTSGIAGSAAASNLIAVESVMDTLFGTLGGKEEVLSSFMLAAYSDRWKEPEKPANIFDHAKCGREKRKRFLLPILAAGGGNFYLFQFFYKGYNVMPYLRTGESGKLVHRSLSQCIMELHCPSENISGFMNRGYFLPFAAIAIVSGTYDGGGSIPYTSDFDQYSTNSRYTNGNNKKFLEKLAEIYPQEFDLTFNPPKCAWWKYDPSGDLLVRRNAYSQGPLCWSADGGGGGGAAASAVAARAHNFPGIAGGVSHL